MVRIEVVETSSLPWEGSIIAVIRYPLGRTSCSITDEATGFLVRLSDRGLVRNGELSHAKVSA